jgi:hypothetical protein
LQCNPLSHDSSNINKLQRVQNPLALSVIKTTSREHIASILAAAALHWLLIAARIEYKIAILTYKALMTQQPSYLFDLLKHWSARPLHSSQSTAFAYHQDFICRVIFQLFLFLILSQIIHHLSLFFKPLLKLIFIPNFTLNDVYTRTCDSLVT